MAERRIDGSNDYAVLGARRRCCGHTILIWTLVHGCRLFTTSYMLFTTSAQ